ncbi:MAG: Ig-like domain-containing protein, partial [bacterium]|nr:Ig-like domain-containing protein [bacterium]
NVPSANVARGTINVLALDVTLPQIQPDTLVAGGGVGLNLSAGNQLYDITVAHNIVSNSAAQPAMVWIEADKSARYTPVLAAATVVATNGDVSAPLVRDLNVKLSGADTTRANGEQYFLDRATIPGYLDAFDLPITPGVALINNRTADNKATILLYKMQGESGTTACPSGYAIGDTVSSVQSPANPTITDVSTFPSNGYCVVQLVLSIAPPFVYQFDENLTLVQVNRDAIVRVQAVGLATVPKKLTTQLKVMQGTYRGLAIGDTIDVEEPQSGKILVYRITTLDTKNNILGVGYVSGDDLPAGNGNYFIEGQVPGAKSSHPTDFLTSVVTAKHNDRDADGIYDNGEVLYTDVNGDNLVSTNDVRLTATTAETVILGNPTDGKLSVPIVTAAQQAGQKWRRQSFAGVDENGGGAFTPDSKPYAIGDDLVIDKDNDRFYQRDVLATMAMNNNAGTAVASTDIERVKVYLDTNNVAGFQTDDTLLGAATMRQGDNKKWDLSPNKVLTGAPRFYITTDIAAGAGDGKTLKFGLGFAAMFFSGSNTTQPSEAMTNTETQTISVAAPPLPPPADGDAPRITLVNPPTIAARSVTYHFTTDEPATSDVTCNDTGFSVGELKQDITIEVAGLQPSTSYVCTITVTDAVGNRARYPQEAVTIGADAPPVPDQQVAASRSSVTVDSERFPANGTSAATIIVMLRDAGGSPVAGRTVNLRKVRAVVAGIGDVVASSVSDGLGRVVFQQTSDTADSFLYSAYVGDQLIGSAQVTFTVVNNGGGGGGGEKPPTPPEVIATFTQCTPLTPAACDEALARRLFGRIILAVERSGEAFYRYPGDLKAYYLGRPAQAFSIMRFMGSGMANKDVARLFVNFSTPDPGALAVFETKDKALAQRFSGKIILQVEAHGEAYYIHPVTLRGYYLGRPADAFRIMREQGLGISNSDLAKLELVSAPESR